MIWDKQFSYFTVYWGREYRIKFKSKDYIFNFKNYIIATIKEFDFLKLYNNNNRNNWLFYIKVI